MRRAVPIAAALLVALAVAPEARAEPDWGVGVFEHDDEGERFVRALYPESARVTVGSHEESDLPLPGLAPSHLDLVRRPDGVLAVPSDGPVRVNGEVVSGPTEVSPDDEIEVGQYTLQIFVSRRADEAQSDEASVQGAVDKASATREEEFGKAAYRFCHDPRFGDRGVVGSDFCVILDESSQQVCPEAARCKDWKELEAVRRFGEVSKGSGSGRTWRRVEEPRPLFDLPSIPPVVSYVLMGLLVAGLVGAFLLSLRKAGWESDELHLDDAELSEAARKLQALPEARSQVLLRMSARALEQGNAGEAAIILHLAILRHLDDEGLARYHPSKTNGDYLRAIRRRRPLAELFKQVALQTERLRFGDGQVDRAAVADALERAPGVLSAHRASSSLAAPSLTALALAAVGLYGCPEGPAVQDYYNHGPAGLSALAPLLRSGGLTVEIRRDRLLELPEEASVVVIRTSAAGKNPWPNELRLDTLLDAGKSVVVLDDLGKSSFFLPSTASVAAAAVPRAVSVGIDADPNKVSCAFPFVGLQERYADDPIKLPEGRQILWDGNSQTSTISRYPLVMHPFLRYRGHEEAKGHTAAHAWAVHRNDGEEDLAGCMFVFADRDLFTNASLTRAPNADFVTRFFALLTTDGGTVVLADRLDQWASAEQDMFGSGPDDGEGTDPTRALKASNMMPFVLQILLVLALLYVHVGAAFGPLRDRELRSHKHFVEHAEAIGRQYAKTGQPGLTHASTALAKFLVHRYRDQLRGGEGGGWAGLAKHLAAKHEIPEPDVRAALRLGIEGINELGSPGPDDPLPSSERMQVTLSRLLHGHRQSADARRGRG